MKATLSMLLFVIFAQVCFSCVWITGTKYNSDSITVGGISPASRLKRSENTILRLEGQKMEFDLKESTNFDDRCDYSVALMYLGKYKESAELLRNLEKEKPGHYAVAANLGTAYELLGDNSNALIWTREGIHRDPNSHYGTEWLHLKILEVKLARESDTNYLETHSVIELHPESIGASITVDGEAYPTDQVTKAMEYQLEERMKFVKPHDDIVAYLLFDYAAVEAATKTLESAKKLLQLAVEYGYPAAQVEPLIKQYNQKIAWRKTKQYSSYVLFGIAAIGILAFLYKRGIFVLSARDLKQ